jgi:hypothetical protein
LVEITHGTTYIGRIPPELEESKRKKTRKHLACQAHQSQYDTSQNEIASNRHAKSYRLNLVFLKMGLDAKPLVS